MLSLETVLFYYFVLGMVRKNGSITGRSGEGLEMLVDIQGDNKDLRAATNYQLAQMDFRILTGRTILAQTGD